VITLITGQPGAGKTLHTIVTLAASAGGRDVYYSGIADCKVPGWIELEDPAKWFDLPAGAIIVIDEAQRHFRPRPQGSAVPAHVARLETHRHAGHDLYLITQHPKLLDTNVRRLVGLHRHVMRAFGAKAAVVHEWNEVKPDPDLSREGSIASTWRYPKDAFTLYKSAEVHTHKARIPARVWLIVASPVLLIGCAFVAYWFVARTVNPSPSTPSAQPAVLTDKKATQGASVAVNTWFEDRTERVPGFPHTAPAFDGVTAPVHAPRPAACVQMGKRCDCYTQQATRLPMNAATCLQIVAGGYFQEWDDAERVQSQTAQPAPSTQAPESSPPVAGHPLQAANPFAR
jgi:zona occludens toxin